MHRTRLEKGDPGADIETLADVLVVLELALSAEHLPRRGSSFAARLRVQKAKPGQRRTGKTSSTSMGLFLIAQSLGKVVPIVASLRSANHIQTCHFLILFLLS